MKQRTTSSVSAATYICLDTYPFHVEQSSALSLLKELLLGVPVAYTRVIGSKSFHVKQRSARSPLPSTRVSINPFHVEQSSALSLLEELLLGVPVAYTRVIGSKSFHVKQRSARSQLPSARVSTYPFHVEQSSALSLLKELLVVVPVACTSVPSTETRST